MVRSSKHEPLFCSNASYMSAFHTLIAQVEDALNHRASELIELRRHLHAHPELSHAEFETTALLVERLEAQGFEVHVRDEGTGFYADLTPDDFDPQIHKTVAIRCDLDALAIEELNDVDYRSKRPGIMHACGHDVHMSVVTGVGSAFDRSTLPGRLRLIYQHAEEAAPGGADELVHFGAVNDVDYVLGLHVDPELEVGKIGVRKGAFTASFDRFQITIHGESGHGARPHHTIDPIFVMTQLINALYTTVGRHFDARDPVVLTIGMIHAGAAANIIPDTATIEGTVRTLSATHRARVKPMLTRICDGICETFGAAYDLDLLNGAPAIINDPHITETIAAVGREVLGHDRVFEIPLPSMGSEDFSHYLQHAPGAMFRLGVASPDRPKYFLHSARFDVDEGAILIGARVLARAALRLMQPA